MQSLTFNKPFFQRGDFPPVVQNGSQSIALQNPWINGTDASPFDQRLYPYICALEDLLTFRVVSIIQRFTSSWMSLWAARMGGSRIMLAESHGWTGRLVSPLRIPLE